MKMLQQAARTVLQQTKARVYVFKVALAGQKRLWRRIAIRSDQTLDQLHAAIYEAFDRWDEHLYSFYFPKPGRRGRARFRDAEEYTHPFNCEDPGPLGWKPRNAAKTQIRRLRLKPGQTFDYLFDFGDQWMHEITVEATDGVPEKGRYPRILERHGESPEQYPDPEK